MSTLRVLSVAVGLCATLVACSTNPVNRTEQGTLGAGDSVHPTDGSFYDEYTFKAKAGWLIEINMTSTEIDSFIQLRRPNVDDETFLEENDDVAPPNHDARLSVTAPASGSYTVWANTAETGDSGSYSLTIRAEPPK